MTPKQARVLDMVRDELHATGLAPTYQEIADRLGMPAKSGVSRTIDLLVAEGKLVKRKGTARPLALPDHADLTVVPTPLLRAELARRGEILDGLKAKPVRSGAACAADGCDSRVPVGHMYCRPHWWAIPEALRERLKEAHNRGEQRPYQAAFQACQDSLYAQGSR